MGQGLEIVQECWVREDARGHRALPRRPYAGGAGAISARHSWSPGEGAEGDRCQRVAPPTPSAKTPRVVGHWHSLGLAGHHIDWPLSHAERWQRLLGLYQREEGATQALEEEDDWQQLKQRLQELTELMECSARWRFAADSAQQVEGRLRALEAENLELTRKLQASSSASGSEGEPRRSLVMTPASQRGATG
ncbi:unnamed protein product [Durusdinium trenchii]|uniref:Uncharacterized protein n=1 Tax=Durusdinium trenchii TaxID=1381693 RepID=A0ABP0IX93_9DINO